MTGWQVRHVPDLFRHEADAFRKLFKSPQIGSRIASGSDLVVPAFTCQQGPRAPSAPAEKGVAVLSLAIAIMVIAPPAGAMGSFDLQHCVNNADRVVNDGIVRAANAVTNEFEETGINDFSRGKFVASARRLIVENQCSAVRI